MPRQEIDQIIFRRITKNEWKAFYRNDFDGGGKQKYIDFPTGDIPANQWSRFFTGITPERQKNGPLYEFEIHSLGHSSSITQNRIYQRRDSTFTLAEQNQSNPDTRIVAWTWEELGFPKPEKMIEDLPDETEYEEKINPDNNLVVYIVRLKSGEYWGGWFQESNPKSNWYAKGLENMFDTSISAGSIIPQDPLFFEAKDYNWPFKQH
tara:strand:- start:321 stop:941 length:621 start_codon:yes stop_codon:yes gene_type:complete